MDDTNIMSLKDLFNQIDSLGTFPKNGPKIQAVLKSDFEPRTVKKTVKGKETDVIVPRIKANAKFPVMKMDLFWMKPEENEGNNGE